MKTKNRKIIAVDIDNTLTLEKDSGWDNESCLSATPNVKMIELVNQAWKNGHFILIYTARRWSRREATVYWLQKNDIKYHALDMGSKPAYDYLIDDKAINSFDLKEINKIIK